jgi:hypothetical protein
MRPCHRIATQDAFFQTQNFLSRSDSDPANFNAQPEGKKKNSEMKKENRVTVHYIPGTASLNHSNIHLHAISLEMISFCIKTKNKAFCKNRLWAA